MFLNANKNIKKYTSKTIGFKASTIAFTKKNSNLYPIKLDARAGNLNYNNIQDNAISEVMFTIEIAKETNDEKIVLLGGKKRVNTYKLK